MTITAAPRRTLVPGWTLTTPAAILGYVAAAMAANLLIAHYGVAATPYVAFILVGLDLTARDALHEAWRHERLVPRMAALIATAGALSWLVNPASGRVAAASVAAFTLAAAADALAFHLTRTSRASRMRAVMLSNVAGAAVDSLAFVLLAFGTVGAATFNQATAKIAGGAVWMLVLTRR